MTPTPAKWLTLPTIINDCYSYSDILRKLGLSTHGCNTETAKKYIAHFDLDTKHFHPRGFIGGSDPRYTDDQVFCKNSPAARDIMRRRYRKLRKDSYFCDKCKINCWCNEPITLEIDHINGDRHDHELNNLRLLCPNCHSQTPTYGSKKRLPNG